MSAEVLRAAAKLMRERAQPCNQGPWVQFGDTGVFTRVGRCVATAHSHDDARRRSEAAHVASWHPAVACTVADWLESVAAWMSEGVGYVPDLDGTSWPVMWTDVQMQALTVARAYLGESV